MMFQRRSLGRRLAAPLTRCPSCGADFVNPVDWGEHGSDHWWMRLRCGECGVLRDVVMADAEAKRYDAELDHGVKIIASALARLEHAPDFRWHGGARSG